MHHAKSIAIPHISLLKSIKIFLSLMPKGDDKMFPKLLPALYVCLHSGTCPCDFLHNNGCEHQLYCGKTNPVLVHNVFCSAL